MAAVTHTGAIYTSKTVIIATGTFLRGRIIMRRYPLTDRTVYLPRIG